MSWWDFGLTCGLALQALLLWRLVRVLRQLREEDKHTNRNFVSRIYDDMRELERKCENSSRQAAKACEGIKFLGAVDIGILHDRGWLILCARIDGRDWVKIQEIKPEMTMEEYRFLVKELENIGAQFRFFDAPQGKMFREYLDHDRR